MSIRTVKFTGPPVGIVHERCIEACDKLNGLRRRMLDADEEGQLYLGSLRQDAEMLREIVVTLVCAAGYLNEENFPPNET